MNPENPEKLKAETLKTTGEWRTPISARFLTNGAPWKEPLRPEQDAETLRIYDATGALVLCLGTNAAAVFRHTGTPDRLRMDHRD